MESKTAKFGVVFDPSSVAFEAPCFRNRVIGNIGNLVVKTPVSLSLSCHVGDDNAVGRL